MRKKKLKLRKLLSILSSNKFYIVGILVCLQLSSCSYLKNKLPVQKEKKKKPPKILFEKEEKYQRDDIESHLTAFKKFYLNDSDVKFVKLYESEKRYLQEIVKNIINNNELFFGSKEHAEIIIVNDNRPFFFSLPGRKIFLSLKLFKKYIKNEHILSSIISYELVRSEKGIYKKNIIAPTGVMNTERMLTLLRIDLESRVKVHKWAFYLMKRAGYDSSIYLNWIQIQNRNSVDFKLFYGDTSIISREEALFKGFLIRNNKDSFYEKSKIKSSKNFFRLVNRINRVRYET
jgi:hypothetical protein